MTKYRQQVLPEFNGKSQKGAYPRKIAIKSACPAYLEMTKYRQQVLPEFNMKSQKGARSRKKTTTSAMELLKKSTNGAYWRIIATTSAIYV